MTTSTGPCIKLALCDGTMNCAQCSPSLGQSQPRLHGWAERWRWRVRAAPVLESIHYLRRHVARHAPPPAAQRTSNAGRCIEHTASSQPAHPAHLKPPLLYHICIRTHADLF